MNYQWPDRRMARIITADYRTIASGFEYWSAGYNSNDSPDYTGVMSLAPTNEVFCCSWFATKKNLERGNKVG